MSRFWRHFVTNGRARLVEGHLGVFGHGVKVGAIRGLRIRWIRRGGPAATAGLRRGDFLLRLGESPIPSLRALERALLDLPVDMPCVARFQRNGRVFERLLSLAEHSNSARRSS